MKKLWTLKRLLFLLVCLALIAGTYCEFAQASFPEKPVTFVVHTNPGGGADIFYRNVMKIAEDNGITIDGYSVQIINRPGGGGIIAYDYVFKQKGDPYYLMPAQMSLVTRPLSETVDFHWSDYTLIANLVEDVKVLVVLASSPYYTVEDIDKAANTRGITLAGAFHGAADSIVGFELMKVLIGDVEYLPFGDTPESIAALLGRDIDVLIGNPMETLSLYEAGRVRYIGVVSGNRNPSLPDIPTLTEQGYNVTLTPIRGVCAPGDISVEAQKKLEEYFKSIIATEDWENYLLESALSPLYLMGDEFFDYMENYENNLVPILEEMGLL